MNRNSFSFEVKPAAGEGGGIDLCVTIDLCIPLIETNLKFDLYEFFLIISKANGILLLVVAMYQTEGLHSFLYSNHISCLQTIFLYRHFLGKCNYYTYEHKEQS